MKIEVENLSCKRGELPVLEGVNFSVDAGQTLILRGPNGIGKTTLLRGLAGLVETTGHISATPEDMAYAGHADGIKSQLNVYENLRFWADVFGTKDITPAVESFDLMPLLSRDASSLSAGQKRRLGLSRLLVTGRPIWILDEPTVSLDAANVEVFAKLIAQHNATGGSAIIATHIELGIEAAVLDLSPFAARIEIAKSPFLDEGYS